MKSMLSIATLFLLILGASPTFAGPHNHDNDGDSVDNTADNCSDTFNPDQDDTDGDDCGNVCDADFDNTGIVGFADFGAFSVAFGGFDLEFDLTETVAGPVGFADFGAFSVLFGTVPGPSGTTAGTTACP